jgi:predicted tellurium resistance membrane protein TerC
MTDHVPIMMIAVVIAVLTMLLAADPLANFIDKNPTVVMLALGFLLMIGAVLIADGFGVHVPKGYIYAAMKKTGQTNPPAGAAYKLPGGGSSGANARPEPGPAA